MENKPKLLIYAATWNEKRNLFFSRYLSDYFEVTIITRPAQDEKIFELIKPVKVIAVKFFFKKKVGLSFSLKFKKIINDIKPAYVMTIETHSISSYQSIKAAGKFIFKPVVFSWQNMETIPKYFFQSRIQKKVLKRSDYLIAGTPGTKKYLIKKHADPGKIFINPETGYDEKIFANTGKNLRRDWRLTADDIIILYAGRFVKEKGINIILDAARKIEQVNPQIKFVFIGKGYLENRIKIFDSQNIHWRGSYDYAEMGNVLRTCNIFVYPSTANRYWAEQFGYSVVEAQACGKPVIATNSGNLLRLVNDGINGSIIEKRDSFSLVEKIFLWCDKLQIDGEIHGISVSKFSGANIALNYKRILINRDNSLLNEWF
jgi:glycosyltransferase involved in cell wall biosynthesis